MNDNPITAYQGYIRPAVATPFTRPHAAEHLERYADRLKDRGAKRHLHIVADDFRHGLDLP